MPRRFLVSLALSVTATLVATGIVLVLTGDATATFAVALSSLFATLLMLNLAADVSAAPRPDVAAAPEPDSASALLDHPAFDALIAALPEPSLIVCEGRIERANSAALELLGRHVLGKDARIAIRHPAVTEYLVGQRAGDEPTRMELVGIGSPEQSWELRIAPLSAGCQLVLLADKSERQAAERMRVDFVANASHELRTPLAGILGFIETLSDRETAADHVTRERFLSIIEGEARRMQRLVSDLMSLSRIEADKFRAPEQTVDLIALAEEVASVFRHAPDLRGGDLSLDLDIGCPEVRGDRAQLSQLIHNLVSNALKYGRTGTPVVLAVTRDGAETVRLTVIDEGDGVPPEHLPRLTERFYRVDSGRSRAMGGTGLGLAIVKHIVERHRGRLQIESQVGKGTKVSVILARVDGAPPAAKTMAPVKLAAERLTVM